MKPNKELNNQDLDDVSGGNVDLEKYLKPLAGKDKNKILVDYGTGVKLDIEPSVRYEEDGNIEIILRDKPEP